MEEECLRTRVKVNKRISKAEFFKHVRSWYVKSKNRRAQRLRQLVDPFFFNEETGIFTIKAAVINDDDGAQNKFATSVSNNDSIPFDDEVSGMPSNE